MVPGQKILLLNCAHSHSQLKDFPLYGRTTEQKADVSGLIYLPKSNAAANGTSPNNLNNS